MSTEKWPTIPPHLRAGFAKFYAHHFAGNRHCCESRESILEDFGDRWDAETRAAVADAILAEHAEHLKVMHDVNILPQNMSKP